MQLHPLLTFSVAALSLLCAAAAQLPPRPPAAPASQTPPPPKPLKEEDAARLLAQIEQMSKTLDEQKYGHNARIIRVLREAGATGDKAFALWLDAMKDVEFEQRGRTAGEFGEWKRRMAKAANRERDAALQLQVQWLAIVLMHSNARTDAARNEAVSAAVMFTDSLIDLARKAEGHFGGHASENVLNTVIAKHFKLDTTLTRRETGAYVPGDVDGIYDRMILPHYREAKMATSLMQAWNKRIEQQTAIAASNKLIEARDKFSAEKLPELKWGQAKDMFQIGQEEPAVQAMLSIIKANLGHRSASQWMDEMTALIKREELKAPAKTPDQPKEAATPGPTPATPPEAPETTPAEKPPGTIPLPSTPPGPGGGGAPPRPGVPGRPGQ